MVKLLDPIPPGEILFEEFMAPLGLSNNKVARDLDVPVARISEIVNGKRGITSDTAIRLGIYFSTTPEFWVNLQSEYDLRLAKRELLPKIKKEIRPLERKSA